MINSQLYNTPDIIYPMYKLYIIANKCLQVNSDMLLNL